MSPPLNSILLPNTCSESNGHIKQAYLQPSACSRIRFPLKNTDVTENSVLNLIITSIYCLLACAIKDGCANSTVTYIDLEKIATVY